MQLSTLDWLLVAAMLLISLVIGIWSSRSAGQSSEEFFLSGRNMPWWLLGISMVATTFSADTPNLVTDIVRNNGVAGNWAWWAFLLTGMLTVFVYAKLWRRSEVVTDLEFYELRYSGKEAAFLRGFRAIYLGIFFNIMIMATVCLAAIKIGSTLLGLDGWVTLSLVAAVTMAYSSLGGLKGVLFTDFFQFGIAMVGSIWATIVVVNLPGIHGLEALLSYPDIQNKLSILPDFNDWDALVALFIMPIAVQWWSVWYPGAEPGGGGYVAQRMLSAKDEKNAIGATLLFNATHYALRPWPWILIALSSLLIYPMIVQPGARTIALHEDATALLANVGSEQEMALSETVALYREKAVTAGNTERAAEYDRLGALITKHPESMEIKSLAYLQTQFKEKDPQHTFRDPLATEAIVYLHLANPNIEINKLGQDLAYPTMLRFLPQGLLGLILASLIAAVMSTISTHLNWGSSYIVNDFYLRFLKPKAGQKELVNVGRISTVGLMVFAALLALLLSNALQAFNILLQIGAGTGLLFILRWFWYRINAWSEITAMAVSFVIALVLQLVLPNYFDIHISSTNQLLIGVGITTVAWISVTLLTQPSSDDVLDKFYKLIRPAGPGWKPVKARLSAEGYQSAAPGSLSMGVLAAAIGCVAIYAALFSAGYVIYGEGLRALGMGIVSLLAIAWIMYNWKKF